MKINFDRKRNQWVIQHPTPTAHSIIVTLANHEGALSTAELSRTINRSHGTTLLTANDLSRMKPPFVVKEQRSGAAPRHPDLNWAPVTWDTVRSYMKKHGIPISEQKLVELHRQLWEEAELHERWLRFRRNSYGWNPEFGVQKLSNSLIVLTKRN